VSLKARIKQMIEASGPMPVRAYMQLCLHDPQGGYYATRPGIGRDFITAPETSQVFGELLGLWTLATMDTMHTKTVTLVEYGPGRGTLMADALRAAEQARPGVVADHLHLVMLEKSPKLRTALNNRFDGYPLSFENHLRDVVSHNTIILGNEYLDCLPPRQFVKVDGKWRERAVGLGADGELTFGLILEETREAHEATAQQRVDWLGGAPDDTALEVQDGLDDLVAELVHRAALGSPFHALFIDYGPSGTAPGDTLRAYKQGKQVDPLAAPGLSDLTVDVDFGRLAKLSADAGLTVHGPVPQGEFLMALGAEARMQALIKAEPDRAGEIHEGVRKLVDPAEMGERFKVICISSPGTDAPLGFPS